MQFILPNDYNNSVFDIFLGSLTPERDATRFPIFVATARECLMRS